MLKRNASVRRTMQRDQQWRLARIHQTTRTLPGRHVLLFSLVLALLLFVGLVATFVLRASPHASLPTGVAGVTSHGAPLSGPATLTTPLVRTGVFPLSSTGPIPVPANVFKPVNSARIVLDNEIYSVYAGSLSRQPRVGALVVLQENIQSGQESLHIYQSPQQLGALTILSLQQHTVVFMTATGTHGHFDLVSDRFQSA